MKYILHSIAIALLCLGCSGHPTTPSEEATNYFPLHVGDYWKYKSEDSTIYEYTIVSTEIYVGKTWYKIRKSALGRPYDSLYFRVENGRVYALPSYPNGEIGPEYLYIDFVNSSNETGGYVKSTADSLLTTVGMHYHVHTVTWHGTFYEGPPVEIYAPHLGMIERKENFGDSFVLISARVNGRVYP
ncbi:MAG: hypothetical protein U0264_04715 [Candidatus Kapaibacterium sp.]